MSPFELLGLAPTLDIAAVKRAYFAALSKHPPHSDPDGFARLRRTYEALVAPGGLAEAFLRCPPDVGSLLANDRARLAERVQAAAQQMREQQGAGERLRELLDRCAARRLHELREA